MPDESWEVDVEALACGRWPVLIRALKAALTRGTLKSRFELCLVIANELGLRSLLSRETQALPQPEDLLQMLRSYERNNPSQLWRLVPALERALASRPMWWIHYVEVSGLSTFDPVELAACCGIARREADTPKAHRGITRIIHHCMTTLLGQFPIPEIQELPRQGEPTLHLDIVRAIEGVQLNWRALGLRPATTPDLVVRWSPDKQWIAWVRLKHFKTGNLHPHAFLRLTQSGQFRLLRRPG